MRCCNQIWELSVWLDIFLNGIHCSWRGLLVTKKRTKIARNQIMLKLVFTWLNKKNRKIEQRCLQCLVWDLTMRFSKGKRRRRCSKISVVTRAMQYSLGFSFSSPYFSNASTTAKSAVSLVDSRMVLYGMLGFRLSAYIRKVPPAGK